MFCTNCGAEIKENSAFCTSCGQKTDNNSSVTNQVTENLSGIIGTKYSFSWKPYRLFKIPFSNKEITNTLELKEDKIDITGSVKLFGKPKFIKSINYSDIHSVDCKIKPANKTIELIIDIFSWLVVVGIILDSEGDYITIFNFIIVILLGCVEPTWSASVLQPVCLTVVEKNGNVTKFKGEKGCIQTAQEAVNNINAMISFSNTNEAVQSTPIQPVKKSLGCKKFLIGTLVVIALIFVWAFVGSGSLSVNDVKKSQLSGYENLTIGKAFDEYFDDTSWEAFETESGIAVVEFQGTFDYKGPTSLNYSSRATVQFAQDLDVSTEYFYVHSIEINITDKNAPSYMTNEGYFLDDNMGSDFLDAVFYNADFEDWIFGP